LIYSAKVASAPFRIPKGSDVLSLKIKSTKLDSITVTVSVSDEERSVAYGEAFAATGNQNIKRVRIFIDDHLYALKNSTAGETMKSMDLGGFNSPTERASLTIDTKGLSSGQHVLYVEAEDSAGFKGTISAAFFDI
jgi:tRNA threonylcarbamoyladenosine modification (KEOPS) complex  Pcc1 subunit